MILQQMLAVPKEKLYKMSKVKVNILPDTKRLYQHFARSIADEIKQNNAQGKFTKIILPVGPTPQQCY